MSMERVNKIMATSRMCDMLGRAFGGEWGVQLGIPEMPGNIYYNNATNKEDSDIVLCHDERTPYWILLCDGEPYVTELIEGALERVRT